MSPQHVYLDHAATTPLHPAALAVLREHVEGLANPHSLHADGRRAHRLLEEARESLAASAGVHPTEIVFTSGGTEADNLALKGSFWSRTAQDPVRRRILYTGIEHHAVLDTLAWLEAHEGAELVRVGVDTDGVADGAGFEAALAADPRDVALATLMWANNETGALQGVPRLAAAAAERGVPMHSDAVQAFGHTRVDLGTPGLSSAALSGHKLGAPVGIGALVLSRGLDPVPLAHGGGHERGVRSGTPDVLGAMAFAAAAAATLEELPHEEARLRTLRDRLVAGVRAAVPGTLVSGPGDPERALPGIVHLRVPGAAGETLLFMLDMAGLSTSTGSACTAGVVSASHVLMAMGLSEADAACVQRVSLGRGSTQADVDAFVAAWPRAVAAALADAPPGARRAKGSEAITTGAQG